MPDIDEDLPVAGPDCTELDLSDETQDFRFLVNLSCTAEHQSLPRRGEKDFEPHGTSSQRDVLAASRASMQAALSYPRVHAPKSIITGSYDPSTGLTVVENQKGQHFRTMGKADANARIHLLPEEALYILERGNLDLRWVEQSDGASDGIPFSLQSAYAILMGQLGLTLERYTVYAGLKRSGYIVQRSQQWAPGDLDDKIETAREINPVKPPSICTWLHSLLLGGRGKDPPPHGPLVALGLYHNYRDIYRLLAIIPYHDPELHAQPLIPIYPEPPTVETKRLQYGDSQRVPLRPSFSVWKPQSDFKKSAPEPPDFHIAVINAREEDIPLPQQLYGLLQSIPSDSPLDWAQRQMYQRLKHGWKNVILAVVDQGMVSYMRIANANFGEEKLYERAGRGRGGKRGGGRGGRRGQGRSNGR